MIHIRIPDTPQRKLSFYLATEEYVARNLNLDDDGFFLWQVQPSVIFGRNQDIEVEVNLEYCRQHGIQFFRRKSGGGCVYADMSNVMMSYITHTEHVGFTFNRYMSMVTSMLAELGIPATSTQNNDVLVGGQKVSGNAYYLVAGHSIVHGTMLFDTDMQHMLHAITPPKSKLDSHGVQSVRQRITLLHEHTSITIDEFKRHAVSRLCDREYILTPEDIQGIEQLEQEYLDPSFIFGRHYKS